MNRDKKLWFVSFVFLLSVFFTGSFAISAEMTDNIKKGISRMSMNRLDDARMYFERETSSNPGNGLAYYYIGEVFYRKAEFSKALENYQKAIEIEPDKPAYNLGAGIAYLALGQTDKAIEKLQAIITGAPGTYEAKQAEQILARIKNTGRDREIVEKWQNAEKSLGVEKVVEKVEKPEAGPVPVQTISVEALVKDARFGPETKRKEASRALYSLTPSQIEPYLSQFIAQMDKEKNEDVKKNLLLVIGRTQTREAVDYLFNVLESPNYLFDTKMVALAGLSETLNPEAAEKLKNVLDKMVTDKMLVREEAKKRIEATEKRIDELESQKFVLRNDIAKLRVQRQEIYDKLNVQPGGEEGPAMPVIAPPETPAGEKPVEILTPEQVKQLRAQLRTIENDINSKESRISRLERQIETLKSEITRNQQLLVKRYGTGTVKVLGVTRTAAVQSEEQPTPGIPPEMMQPGGPGQPAFTQAGAEEEQEQSLALSIIKILGRIGKPDHLSVIERAWEEYKANSFELDYGLVRAQLGSYEYIEKLVSRLQEDYPASDTNEIYFRADIVKTLGNYLAGHENQDYTELLGYLAESDPNQVIKIAANQALSKIRTKETPARQT